MPQIPSAQIASLPLGQPFDIWITKTAITDGLWNKYSSVLDVRVANEADDYLLWSAIDVRKEYGYLANPDCEHLAIAVLILEGAISKIVSANWDGLIEASIDQLSPCGRAGVLQVIVDPAHIRDPQASATLVKFHGCAVLCVVNPDIYRKFLVATKSQITDWPNKPDMAALRGEVQQVATGLRALMVGLSLQDANLQDTFSRARAALPWTWPCAPEAQWHVFCEDKIGESQDDMLRVAYGASFGPNAEDIRKAALLRAYAKPALTALAINVVFEKLQALVRRDVASRFQPDDMAAFDGGLRSLRDAIASAAPSDHDDLLEYIYKLIIHWTRGLALYRRGDVPIARSVHYECLSPLPLNQMLNDPNVAASGFGTAGVALALLGRQQMNSGLLLSPAPMPDSGFGALQAVGAWENAKIAQVFFVQDASAAIRLTAAGAFDGDNVVVLHSDDTWNQLNASANVRSPHGSRAVGNRVRHVSVSALLNKANTLLELEQRFMEEVTI